MELFGSSTRQKTALCLNEVVNSVLWQKNMLGFASSNVKDNVVELVKNGRHAANGLLITHNGYFLTPYHCVKFPKGISVRHRGKEHSVDEVVYSDFNEDVALAKADLPGDLFPVYSKLFPFSELPHNMPITKLGVMDGKRVCKIGTVDNFSSLNYENGMRPKKHFCTKVSSVKGDSGSVILDPSNAVVGLACGSSSSVSTGISIEAFLDGIRKYSTKLYNS